MAWNVLSWQVTELPAATPREITELPASTPREITEAPVGTVQLGNSFPRELYVTRHYLRVDNLGTTRESTSVY